MTIRINKLSKLYGKSHYALKDVSLNIGNGMFGLLGPNGAGKTTLMRILVTLLKPTSGTVTYDDLNLQRNRGEIRAMLGYLPQDFSVFSKLTTWEFLDYIAALSGLKNKMKRSTAVEEMLENVNLYDVRDRQVNKLSGGMKRRLGIAQALIGQPSVVVVDEPTTGLDPEERLKFRNLLADMSRRDMIIILSTHIVGDISSSCTDMALLNHGQVQFNGPPEKLIDQANGHVWLLNVTDNQLADINERYTVVSTVPSEHGYEVKIVADKIDSSLAPRPADPNLEDAYVYFMVRLEQPVSYHSSIS